MGVAALAGALNRHKLWPASRWGHVPSLGAATVSTVIRPLGVGTDALSRVVQGTFKAARVAQFYRRRGHPA